MPARMSIVLAGLAAFSVVAFAAPAPAGDAERFSIAETAQGYVRTDVATGETSLCTLQGDKLICRLAADDRDAYMSDIEALQQRLSELEGRVSALEGKPSQMPSGDAQPSETPQEFSESLDRMEQFFRRFMGIVKDFQDFGADEPTPAPDKT
jgi:hypothetical protein